MDTHVINQLVRTMGVGAYDATRFVEVVHEIVEEEVTDDVSVVAPPLIVGRFGCPVLDRLILRLDDPRWTLPESIDVASQELAEDLRLPVEVIEAYPMVGRFGLLAKVMDRVSAADDDAELYAGMLDIWLQTYAGSQEFDVKPTGSKEALRSWLLDRLELLGRFGYPARIATDDEDGIDGLSYSFDDGRRPDIICRVTGDGDVVRDGDWLIVQHKATAAGHTAHDELAAHVDWLRAELGEELGDNEVHGLLVADGASLLLERALRERAFGYLSLTALGYRRWVRSHTKVQVAGDPDRTAIAYPATIRPGHLMPVAG